MKKLGLLALLLSVSVASVGCEPKKADKKPAAPAAGEKAADPAVPAATDAPAADTPKS